MKTLLLCLSLAMASCCPQNNTATPQRFTTEWVGDTGCYHIIDTQTGVEYLSPARGGIIKLEKLPLESIK